MPTGAEIVGIAETKLGQRYVFGADVPLNDRSWTGPWDCAEYCSWAVYQVAQIVYGCTNDNDPPDKADAYTGAWKNDVLKLGIQVPVGEAATIQGAMLLRRDANSGHIVISNGDGNRTLEARGAKYGVMRYVIADRVWDYGVLVPGIQYDRTRLPVSYTRPLVIRNSEIGRFSGIAVTKLQRRLAELGFYEGSPTGDYDDKTEIAVRDFQVSRGLTPDGQLAAETAGEIGVSVSQDEFEYTETK